MSKEYFAEDLGNGISLDMVYIPGGKFMMGSPEYEEHCFEEPQHEVTVKPFFIGKYPITQAQWRAIASLPKIERDLKPNPSRFKGDKRPVEEVSWEDAVEFCQRLSKQTGKEYRLPSEAEWEYACRAGTTTPYYFGEDITKNYFGKYFTKKLANCRRSKTTAVGKYPPNVFGLYDMHGNVMEWCQDDWHDNYKGAPDDGSAWLSGLSSNKVLRGGSWNSLPVFCRSAYRDDLAHVDRSSNFGFRVVCVAPRTT